MTSLTREQQLLGLGSLVVLATVAGSFALYWTAPLMVPFVLSFFVSYLVGPLVDVVEVRLRAPRWAAIAVAMVVVAVGCALLVSLLWTSATGLAGKADLYADRLVALGRGLQAQLERLPPRWVPKAWTKESLDPAMLLASFEAREVLATVGTQASDLLTLLSELLGDAVLVVLFSVYLLSGRTPGQQRPGIWGDIDRTVEAYLVTKFAISAVVGAVVGGLLWAIGLDLALVFGVLTFLLNFVPNVGPAFATLLPLPLALVQFDDLFPVALVFLLPSAVHFVVGNVLEPRIMGESLDLHPVTVLLTLIFWGLLWGPVGLVLATPITAVLCIVLARFETTRPVADVLAGRGLARAPSEARAA